MEFPATFIDQMGNAVQLVAPPRRIISLVPSQTELLSDLGLKAEVAGITKFCIHPQEWFRSKPQVGGTKQLHMDKIAELQPDLIIGNKEENEEEQIRELQTKYPVWMSDIHNLDEALIMMREIGRLTLREEAAAALIRKISEEFKNWKLHIDNYPERTAAYLIWRTPYMAAGKNTFIDSMLQYVQLRNVITSPRYPETTLHELAKLSPEVIMLSSEPYPFAEKHIQEIQSAVPTARIVLVDGEIFSWYGSRLRHAPGYFRDLLRTLKYEAPKP